MKSMSAREIKMYHIYSAMILSVYGATSIFSKSSILLTALFSVYMASALNLAEDLVVAFLLCFNKREPHIFDVIRLAFVELFGILICHCGEGAKICAIFTCLSENERLSIKNSEWTIRKIKIDITAKSKWLRKPRNAIVSRKGRRIQKLHFTYTSYQHVYPILILLYNNIVSVPPLLSKC